MKKLVFALMVVAVLLVVAMPAAAQGPVVATTDQGPKPIFVRTAGTNEDPFGGLPLYGTPGAGLGATTRFSGGPLMNLVPGGVPSTNSGDGTTPRKSIYLGGAWSVVLPPDQKELPTCATITIPAGSSRWFKMDTWKDKLLQIWLDDELDGATSPSGRAVFGAPSNYNWGTWPGSVWQQNAVGVPGVTLAARGIIGKYVEGYAMRIYGPAALMPNFEFAPPNAALYTDTAPGTVGWAEQNPNQPTHLLWYQGQHDGWVHARVYNQMIWNGTVSVCSYRASK